MPSYDIYPAMASSSFSKQLSKKIYFPSSQLVRLPAGEGDLVRPVDLVRSEGLHREGAQGPQGGELLLVQGGAGGLQDQHLVLPSAAGPKWKVKASIKFVFPQTSSSGSRGIFIFVKFLIRSSTKAKIIRASLPET